MERIIQFQQYESGVDYMKTYKMVNLGEIITPAKIVKCGDGEYPVLSMTMHNGLVFQDDKFKKEIASSDKSNYKVVYKNQLVISFPIDEGVLAAQRITDAGIVSPAYGIWDIDQSRIRPEYLEMALRSERALQYYKANLRGSTARRRSLPTPTLLAFEVPLPSIEEQEKVLETIHIAEKMVELYNNESEQLDNLIKARFIEMFGSIHESTEYPYVAVKDLTDVISGGTPSRDKTEYWDGGTIPWVKTTELQNNVIIDVDEYITEAGLAGSSAKLVPAGTVLVAMYGQGKTRGMTAYLDIEATTNQACACILPSDKIDSVFLWKYFELSYDKLRSLAQGAGQPNLNGNMIKNFQVLVPPIEMQNEFVSFVHQVDKSKVVVQKGLSESMIMLSSLRQDYFG